jgi:hypothetical protein
MTFDAHTIYMMTLDQGKLVMWNGLIAQQFDITKPILPTLVKELEEDEPHDLFVKAVLDGSIKLIDTNQVGTHHVDSKRFKDMYLNFLTKNGLQDLRLWAHSTGNWRLFTFNAIKYKLVVFTGGRVEFGARVNSTYPIIVKYEA